MDAPIRQQINLYQPIFSEERKQFSASAVAVMLGVVAAALAGFSGHTQWRLHHLADEVALLRQQQSEREALVAVEDGLSPEERSARLQASIAELEDSVDVRSRALDILKSGAAGETNGFAARLEALARRHVEGVWIDGLTLSGTSAGMSLTGATRDPDLVPRYLASLAHDPVLSGTRFDDFFIERPKDLPLTVEKSDGDDIDNKQPKSSVAYMRFRASSSALATLIAEPST